MVQVLFCQKSVPLSATGLQGVYNYLGFTPATTFIDDDAISVYNTSFYYVTAEDDPTDAGIALQPIPNRIQSPTIQPQNPQKKAPNPAMIKSRR